MDGTDLPRPGRAADGSSHPGLYRIARRVIAPLLADEIRAELRDFSTTPRVIYLSLIAIVIGVLSAFVALVLLRLIGLFTNLFFFLRWGTQLVPIDHTAIGPWIVIVPALGGLAVGLIARFGSQKLMGDGIPEAIEAILIGGSRVQPRIAALKPLVSAITIGSGGPFGAEGPIIMSGGAFGSLVAQFLHLSNAERKTLLIAGAAGGVAAIFATPVAGVLLAIEVMLFEWKPRSLIPVALAAATAMWMRHYLIGAGPLFPTPLHTTPLNVEAMLGTLFVGLTAGALAAFLTLALYAAEDAFHKLPIHWMWWPAIGGLAVGIGGLIYPRALGVGYDVIGDELAGHATVELIVGILLVKTVIWVAALSSGGSGGVFAPVMMIGGALGAAEAGFLPHMGAGFWPLVCMGATLGGVMRAPLTGIVLSVELTHDINMAMPLILATGVSYGVTVLSLRRSILTEKVARHGYHLSAEYAVDPLEVLLVREVMRRTIVTIAAGTPLKDLTRFFVTDRNRRRQGLYPVVDADGRLRGVVTRSDILELQLNPQLANRQLADLVKRNPVVAYPDEPLRAAVYRMAETGFTRLPVVDREDPRRLVGLVALSDVLAARRRNIEEERRRERVLRIRTLVPILHWDGQRGVAVQTTESSSPNGAAAAENGLSAAGVRGLRDELHGRNE